MRLVWLILIVCASALDAQAQFRRKAAASTDPGLNYAAPSEYTLAGIEVTGLNVLDKNAMVALTGLKIGDKIKIPGDAISGAIRKLWKHGLIGDATISVDRIDGLDVYLVIKLAERPRLIDFYFTGISKGRQSSLKEDLNLIRGKIVNDAMVRNTELTVKRHFVKKGFLNTQVKVVQESDTVNRGQVRLRIDVDLKSKVKINEIVFDGNTAISDAKLKKKMKKTHERPRLSLHRALLGMVLFKDERPTFRYDSVPPPSWQPFKDFINKNVKLNVFNGSKFIKSDYDEDKLKVIEYYNTKGYRDAEIVADTIINQNKSNINIVLKVNEGRKYYFRNIYWTGNYIHSTATLSKILDINKGDVYNNELIVKKTSFNPKGADISGLYMDDGYLFFRVNPIEVAVEGDSIDVEMRIFEGDQATIDQVLISGNERTSDHVIRRELSTIPGQKFRRSDLIRTQQMLGQMGYFNAQKIEPDVRPNPANGTVDIEWKLEEQSNDQIELSGGWGGVFGFVGTLGLSFNNFSVRNVPHFKKWRPLPVGDGQKFSLRVQANGRNFQSYSVSFTEPWLGGRKPNSLSVSFNYSISRRLNTSFEFDDNNSIRNTGVTIGFGRRLEWPDNYFSLTHSLSYLVYDYRNWFGNTTVLPNSGITRSVMLNTTLSRNSIDNPMYPTSGSTLSLSLSLTPPYSSFRDRSYYNDINQRYDWIEMHKWMLDTKFYLRLLGSKKPDGRSLVLEAKAHFGFIGAYDRSIGYGPFERFFLGGDGLAGGFNSFVLGQEVIGLRGYRNNTLTPPLYNLYGTQNPNGIEGGIVYNKLGMELRYPVTTGQTATIYGFTFVEAGNNWDSYRRFNPFDMYKSAGVGARIFMPAFGLIGLNWAYGFDKVPNGDQPGTDRSGSQFHFTIGQQIR